MFSYPLFPVFLLAAEEAPRNLLSFILFWWKKQNQTFTQKLLVLMQWIYFMELHFNMLTNISFLLHGDSCISLGAGCLPNVIWWSIIMFPHLESVNISYHWNGCCALQISPRPTCRKEQVYRSKRHALGNLERMSSVINKIGLQLHLRTTSSNHPPQGNNKINYCSGLQKSLHIPLRNSFPKCFCLFSRKVPDCQENTHFHPSNEPWNIFARTFLSSC